MRLLRASCSVATWNDIVIPAAKLRNAAPLRRSDWAHAFWWSHANMSLTYRTGSLASSTIVTNSDILLATVSKTCCTTASCSFLNDDEWMRCTLMWWLWQANPQQWHDLFAHVLGMDTTSLQIDRSCTKGGITLTQSFEETLLQRLLPAYQTNEDNEVMMQLMSGSNSSDFKCPPNACNISKAMIEIDRSFSQQP